VQRVTPQLGQRRALQVERFVFVQRTRQLGLAARHEHHVFGFLLQAKRNRVVGGGVARVQRGDHINLVGQGIAVCGFGHAEVEKLHALEPQALRQCFGRLDQLAARLDAVNTALPQSFEKQVVNDETQIRLARAVVGQGGALLAGGQFFQQLFDELKQVIHLLELATRILVELAVAGEDVQLFEQLDGLAGAQVEV